MLCAGGVVQAEGHDSQDRRPCGRYSSQRIAQPLEFAGGQAVLHVSRPAHHHRHRVQQQIAPMRQPPSGPVPQFLAPSLLPGVFHAVRMLSLDGRLLVLQLAGHRRQTVLHRPLVLGGRRDEPLTVLQELEGEQGVVGEVLAVAQHQHAPPVEQARRTALLQQIAPLLCR